MARLIVLVAVIAAVLIAILSFRSDRPQPRGTGRAGGGTPVDKANAAREAQLRILRQTEREASGAKSKNRRMMGDASDAGSSVTTHDAQSTAPPAPEPDTHTSVTMRLLVRDWSTSKPLPGVAVHFHTDNAPLTSAPRNPSGPADALAFALGSLFQGTTTETAAFIPAVPSVASGEAGEYLISALLPGAPLALTLSVAGYTPLTLGPFGIPGGTPQFEKTVRMAAVGGLSGRVVEPGSTTPVTHVRISYRASGRESELVTGEDGRFLLQDLPSGTVTVQFAPKQTWPEFARQFTTVQGMTKDVGDIELTKIASSIRGRVIRMPGEHPVPDQTVELTKRNDNAFRHTAKTDEEGVFYFPDLPNGTYIAWVLEPGIFQQVTLASEDQRDLVLRIGGVKLRGRVTREGEPVMANVHLSQGATGFLKEMSARTDSDGWFELNNVSSGWWLGAMHATSLKGTWNDWFVIPETDVYEYQFVIPSGKVVGVVSGSEGRPVADARVFIVKNDSGSFDVTKPAVAMETRSRADGGFTLTAGKGKFQLRASRTGSGISKPVPVDVPEIGETAPVMIRLEPNETGTIRSVALDYADGAPVKDATLNLYDSVTRLEVKSSRDEDGIMTLEEIAPGKYRVLVSGPGYSVDEKHVEVTAGETAEVVSVLYESGSARIVVQDARGEFMPEVRVQLTPEDGSSIEETRTGTTSRGGLVMVRGLSPGGYVVKAMGHNGEGVEEKIRVKAREITDWLLIMK